MIFNNDEDDDDPNDPRHRDFDLSEAGIGHHREYDSKPFFLRRGVLLVVAVLVIVGLFLPFIRLF